MSLLSDDYKRGAQILDSRELLSWAQDASQIGRDRFAEAIHKYFDDQRLTPQEQAIAGDIILNLIRQAEVDLREALAERLALHDNVPSELVVYLANDTISVARHVLTHSPALNDVDLIYVMASKAEEHWQAIARRPGLSPVVADRLIDTNDPGTILNLIDNQRVNLQKSSMKKLVRAAMRSEELQAPLLRRPEVDSEVAVDLYMVVSQALRREIAERFPVPPHLLDEALEGLVHELGNTARGNRETTPEMLLLARKFKERGEIGPELMIRTLRRGQIGFFIALFAVETGFGHDQVLRMLQKDSKAFVVACRHLGMMKTEFASIFLLSRGIRSGDKIVDQRELAMALKGFDQYNDYDIDRIITSWRKDPSLI